ncbi:MAG: D-alanyl-D-alanine carboxypeptidase family protein [Clostridia bacterium]
MKTFKKIILLTFIFLNFIFVQHLNIITATTTNIKNDKLNIYSKSAILTDFESGSILFEKNIDAKVFPASTTKILTAILVIENLNLNDKIVVTNRAIYSTPVGSSIIYLKPGEVLSVEDLLYGLLLNSGNDAANVLAESVSDNIPSFIELINTKLKEIGCNNTNFTNAHGFHDKNHYTTARDMSIIFNYCMKNETFKKIIETKEYVIKKTNKFNERKLINTNKLLDIKSQAMYYEYALGGKTGYTEEANGTFVGYAKKDDKQLLSCVFDSSQNINGKEGRFLDTKTLFEYGFNNFYKEKVLDKNNFTFKIIDKSNSKVHIIKLKDDIYSLVKTNTVIINYKLDIFNTLYQNSNIIPGTIIGKADISLNGDGVNLKSNYELDYINSYNSLSLKKSYKFILTFILFISLSLLLIFKHKLNAKKNKRKGKKIHI